jgi:hypothetical protein
MACYSNVAIEECQQHKKRVLHKNNNRVACDITIDMNTTVYVSIEKTADMNTANMNTA